MLARRLALSRPLATRSLPAIYVGARTFKGASFPKIPVDPYIYQVYTEENDPEMVCAPPPTSSSHPPTPSTTRNHGR